MGANFTPDMQGYTSMKPFRFWCQKVLPSIYDDSLSYYEVLCKLVKILNTVIENMEKVEANVDALLNAFNLLQGWVNDYFDNLDVQDEIDDKLDRMVEDGTFDRYIEPIMEQYEQQVQSIAGHAVDEAREEINTIVGQGESAIRDVVRLYEVQAKQYVEDAEAWARGTVDGVPVPSTAEQYEDSSKYWAEQAQQAAGGASGSDEDAEAWAVGTKGGVPVTSDDPQYENSSKYWAEYTEQIAQSIPDLSSVLTEVGKKVFFIRPHLFHIVNTSTVNEFGNSVIRFTCSAIDPLFTALGFMPAIVPFKSGGMGAAGSDIMYRVAVCSRLGLDGQGNYVYGVRVLDNSGNDLPVGTEVTLGFVVVGIPQNGSEYTPTP